MPSLDPDTLQPIPADAEECENTDPCSSRPADVSECEPDVCGEPTSEDPNQELIDALADIRTMKPQIKSLQEEVARLKREAIKCIVIRDDGSMYAVTINDQTKEIENA